jgi:hypothetical protein
VSRCYPSIRPGQRETANLARIVRPFEPACSVIHQKCVQLTCLGEGGSGEFSCNAGLQHSKTRAAVTFSYRLACRRVTTDDNLLKHSISSLILIHLLSRKVHMLLSNFL